MAESYPKRVENTVGKGESVRYEQFLLFPQCFQKACFPGASKVVIVWEWVNKLSKVLKSHRNLAIENRAKKLVKCYFITNISSSSNK